MSEPTNSDFSPIQHRYLDSRFNHLESSLAAAVLSQEKLAAQATRSAETALMKAEALAAHNQAVSNEFREQLRDQAETLMGRQESLIRFASTDEKIEKLGGEIAGLRESRSAMDSAGAHGRYTSALFQWAVVAAILLAGVLVSAAMLFLRCGGI